MARAALAAGLAALAFAPAATAAPPTGSFNFVPGPPDRPNLNEVLTFSAAVDWDGAPVEDRALAWNFGDGTGATIDDVPDSTSSITHAYGTAGPKVVTMTPVTGDGAGVVPQQTVVVNAPPVAAFTFGPPSPFTGQEVQFASESDDPDDTIVAYAWNLGDGAASDSRSPRHPYLAPGPKTVTLTVTDSFGATSSTSQQVAVTVFSFGSNASPQAGFAFSPRSPKAGDVVEFASSAVDPEGDLREQRWDLDGDGQFDDAQGDQVLHTFSSAGVKTVRLRVEDGSGAAAVRERAVTVARGQVAGAGFLNPFPVVRITGEVRPGGTVIRVLSVRAPRGTKVRLSCRGKGCPAKAVRRTARRAPVRFRAFERMLRAGIELEIFVRKAGTIGKYTRFTIRAGASPKRVDRCLVPGARRPIRCPS